MYYSTVEYISIYIVRKIKNSLDYFEIFHPKSVD